MPLTLFLIATNEGEYNNSAFDVVPLFEDDIFLAAPATEQLDTTQLADLRDYADRKFVSLAEGFCDVCRISGGLSCSRFLSRKS